ncbi:MAG: NUDIX domain-containing protein, partial [Crocinitomicaceae bacterium]
MGVNNSIITVICGIITNAEGKIFIARRKKDKSLGGKWEFPGGKIEKDETQEECLQRELNEELNMQVKVGEK